MERMVGKCKPKVLVLLLMVVCTWGVADGSEGNHGDLVEVTGLSNSRGLHVDSECIREVGEYIVELTFGAYELIARGYKTHMECWLLKLLGNGHKMGVGVEETWKPLNLTPLVSHANIEIVLHEHVADNDIHYMDIGGCSACYSCGNDEVWVIVANELGGG